MIAFANGAPDLLSNSSAGAKADGALISLGASLGGLVFALTMVASNVIMNAKRAVVFPKMAITKEIGFLSLTVVWVTIFSFIGTHGYPFLACYFGTYAVYIVVTLLVEKFSGKAEDEDLEGELENQQDDDGQRGEGETLTVNESRAFEAVISIEESDLTQKKKDNFLSKIIDDLHE